MNANFSDTDYNEYETENMNLMSDEAVEFVKVWDWK
jgi:hypothetical protein